MKVAYIAHPISGDIKGNLSKIEAIGRQINLEEENVVPFAPYFFDCHSLNDDIESERNRGIKNDVALLKMGFVSEVRLYGDRISNGMAHEVELAIKLGIKVLPMTKETQIQYARRWGADIVETLQKQVEVLAKQVGAKDSKIKEYQTSIQALNRDLDAWEPLANLIASFNFKTNTTHVPTKGIELIHHLNGSKPQ